MSEGDRLSIIEYVRERFDKQDTQLENIITRLEALESDKDKRDGRNSAAAKSAKFIAGLVATILAALGIKSQVG